MTALDVIENIKSYENEECCIIVLSQKENKALLGYINNIQKENELLKEELKELKDGIIGIYNNMNSLEIINKHELESDIEEI